MVTVAGEEYTFVSPNAETVATLVKDFLAGLRKRSKWGVGLQDFSMGKGGKNPEKETKDNIFTNDTYTVKGSRNTFKH